MEAEAGRVLDPAKTGPETRWGQKSRTSAAEGRDEGRRAGWVQRAEEYSSGGAELKTFS